MVTSKKQKIGMFFVHIALILMTFFLIMPFLLLLIASITEENSLIANGYSFFPEKLSLKAYAYLMNRSAKIVTAYAMTITVTVIGTFFNIFISSMLAYGLSLKNLPGRRFLSFYVFFTILFNGGLVPTYLMYTNIFSIKDTLFAMIVPTFLMNAMFVILMRTFFIGNIPDALYEAAEIDGAGHYLIYTKIVLPLGKPILVSMGLFAALGYWNDWTNSLYYIQNKKNLWGIQSLLNKMITDLQFLTQNANVGNKVDTMAFPSASVRMAIAFVGVLPILCLYPFLQKYFAKGISVGAIKG